MARSGGARSVSLALLFAGVVACQQNTPVASDAGTTRDGGFDAGSDAGCANGTALHVASGVELCLPKTICTSETCPPQLGSCDGGSCIYKGGYQGLQTFPQAWVTYYCELSTGGCDGVTQIETPAATAAKVAQARGIHLCAADAGSGDCAGIAAGPPMEIGNSQDAVDPRTGTKVANWGLGLTEASGLCYRIVGPGGSAVVALTDRCGGYCKCNGSGFEECGPCVNAPDLAVNCSCVSAVPGVFTGCCGDGCATTLQNCDWCASNTHPHFDLDLNTFNHVCGSLSTTGSCQLSQAEFLPCLAPNPAWPPGGSSSCAEGEFACTQPQSHSDQGSLGCCCDYDLCPQSDGSCAASPPTCKQGSCTCAAGQPDAEHRLVSSTGCCCTYGATPEADGTCQ